MINKIILFLRENWYKLLGWAFFGLVLYVFLLIFSSCSGNSDKEYIKAGLRVRNYVDSTYHEAKKEVPAYIPKDSL